MRTLLDKIARRVTLARGRYRFEHRRVELETADIETRLRPDMRGRFQQPTYYSQMFRGWLPETPQLLRAYREEYLPRGTGALLAGKIEVLGRQLETAAGVDWHRDPLFDVVWPRKFVGALSMQKRGSDVVLLWHLNKMMFLLDASYAYRVTGDDGFARRWVEWVDSWTEQNPFMVGINWRSPLEIGTRLVVWTMGLQEIGFTFTIPEASLGRIVRSLVRQAEYVAGHFSRRDPPNNHLIGEAATLYTFAALWPLLEGAGRWRGECERILADEIKRQVLPDGMHFENAFNYHAYVLDFYLLYLYAKCLEDEPPDSAFIDGTARLAENFLAFRSPTGRVPRFGDDSLTEFLVLKPMRELEARRFGGSHTLTEIVKPDFAEVIAATDWGRRLMRTETPGQCSIHRQDSGFTAFRGGESHLVYASGPEHTSPFSHGHLHSDAGSFELEIAGAPVFIDSGTYLYGKDESAREHFKGARAHNSVLIDDRDPLASQETFKWVGTRRGRTTWFSSDGECRAVGSLQVLPSSRGDFYHERVLAQIGEVVWIIVDRVGTPRRESVVHSASALFHTPLPPDRFEIVDGTRLGVRLDVGDDGSAVGMTRKGAFILRGFSSAGYARGLISDRSDKRSWYSPAYGDLRYGTTIEVSADFTDTLMLVHSFAGEDVRAECRPREDARVVVDVDRGGARDRLSVCFDPARVEWNGRALEENR
ncbi:MAG: alginate lyase family protein [Candidatus Krumholzibacteriia bacterium]